MKKERKTPVRFGYFYLDPNLFYPTTPPTAYDQETLLDIQLGRNASDYYRTKFDDGREEAIFEYVRESPACFQSPWVTDQIEKWRIENTPQSRKKLDKLFKAYIGEQRGKIALRDLKKLIERDKRIFYEIVKQKRRFPKQSVESIILRVAQKLKPKDPNLTIEQSVWLIYKNYKKASDFFTGVRKTLTIEGQNIVTRRTKSDWKFKNEMEFINYFRKTPLDDIIKRNVELSLSLDYRLSRHEGRIILKSERKSRD